METSLVAYNWQEPQLKLFQFQPQTLDEIVFDTDNPAGIPTLDAVLSGRLANIYNAAFDAAFLTAAGISCQTVCAMLLYARYHGEWSNYYDDFKWQSLAQACWDLQIEQPSAHRALGDCQSTLAVLQASGVKFANKK